MTAQVRWATTNNGSRLILPGLGRLYVALHDLAYAVLRIASGAMLATFGYSKLFAAGGMARDIALFKSLHLWPAAPLAYFTSGLEFFGGLLIALGLLTRPIAAMLTVEFVVIVVMVMIPRGANYQLSVVWLGAFFYLAIRGGGRYSLDRIFGKEF
ncbi:MAG TPA: DoxX family protein [Pseudolabrys sp.]|nr:DoxX family protein [Pseudolabrys sp.]